MIECFVFLSTMQPVQKDSPAFLFLAWVVVIQNAPLPDIHNIITSCNCWHLFLRYTFRFSTIQRSKIIYFYNCKDIDVYSSFIKNSAILHVDKYTNYTYRTIHTDTDTYRHIHTYVHTHSYTCQLIQKQ